MLPGIYAYYPQTFKSSVRKTIDLFSLAPNPAAQRSYLGFVVVLAVILYCSAITESNAHGGGLDSYGCHRDVIGTSRPVSTIAIAMSSLGWFLRVRKLA
jgi:hypothetical protein